MSLNIFLYRKWNGNKETCYDVYDGNEYLHEQNITNNLWKMAVHAGIGEAVWESAGKTAGDITRPLLLGIVRMENEPEFYKRFNAKNGWGLYEGFLPWLKKLLQACIDYPEALIRTS